MSKKTRKVLTEREISDLCAWRQVRLTWEQCAKQLGICSKTLERCLKHDDAARVEIEKAEGKASFDIRKNAYQQAISGNTAMAIFWLKTQEGFRETERIELTGKDGEPLKFSDLNREQKNKRIEKLLALKQAAKKKIKIPDADLE